MTLLFVWIFYNQRLIGMIMKFKVLALAVVSASLVACGGSSNSSNNDSLPSASADLAPAMTENYADMAHAMYSDSLTRAVALHDAIDALADDADQAKFDAAKTAWLNARVVYQQSEIFRFDEGLVDDWEGQLNAWPLDEGLIDYVDASYEGETGNNFASLNVVATNDHEFVNGAGDNQSTATIDTDLLTDLQEIGGSEANVATGYHAIEFLLWGQDLNGTNAGAGARAVADYIGAANKDRRAEYLKTAADLLVADLTDMVAQWADDGDRRDELTLEATNDPKAVVSLLLTSLAKLSAGELASERMATALDGNSTEDEHDCFSDNTHNSHYFNAVGLNNLLNGTYTTGDTNVTGGTSIYDVIAASNPEAATAAKAAMTTALTEVTDIKTEADKVDGMKFDQMIGENNAEGAAIVKGAIDALKDAGDSFVDAAKKLNITITTDV